MAIDLRGLAPLLLVYDLPRSIAFYRDILGFRVVSTSGPDYRPGWALLERRGAEIMLNGSDAPESRPPAQDPTRMAAHGDTALYFGCPDLDAAYAHLCAHDVEVAPPMMTGYGFRSLALHDPDGYSLVFHWPATEAAVQDWVQRYGIDFSGNPPPDAQASA